MLTDPLSTIVYMDREFIVRCANSQPSSRFWKSPIEDILNSDGDRPRRRREADAATGAATPSTRSGDDQTRINARKDIVRRSPSSTGASLIGQSNWVNCRRPIFATGYWLKSCMFPVAQPYMYNQFKNFYGAAIIMPGRLLQTP